jgi:membrane-bound metal-dependent hydrolase YbcI (DUF457 family)
LERAAPDDESGAFFCARLRDAVPFTPFHFGPGSLVHSVAPKHISFLAFCGANVLVDVEPLYFMLTHQYPIHRFFHTYVGATVAAGVVVALFAVARKVTPQLLDDFRLRDLSVRAVALGSLLGAYSHVLLDSLMHADIEPFAPFSTANPLLGAVFLNTLHGFCLVAGFVGAAVIGLRHFLIERKRNPYMNIPRTYRLRFRFWVQKQLSMTETEHWLEIGGREVLLRAAVKDARISDSRWLILSATGFGSESDARAYGDRLRIACEISSVMARLGVNTGIDQATLSFSRMMKENALQQGTVLRDNVHGIDVFPDDPNVLIPTLNAEGTVRAAPQPFLGEMSALFEGVFEVSTRVRNIILLLNYALSRTDPVAQIVFSVSAVEMLGQDFELWTDAQKKLLGDLVAAAQGSGVGDESERKEVVIALQRLHRLGLRQGVMRLLSDLDRIDLRKRWDTLYEKRSSLVHGLAPAPGVRYDELAQESMTVCAQILLTAVAREIPAVKKEIEKYYPL